MDWSKWNLDTKLHLCTFVLTFQEAELAKAKGNGRKLDKSHSLVVNIFDDFERYKKVPDEWMPPLPPEIKPCTHGVGLFSFALHLQITRFPWYYDRLPNILIMLSQENLQRWITDEKARDQFVIRAGTSTEVYWNDARQLTPELVYQKQVFQLLFLLYALLATVWVELWVLVCATSISQTHVYISPCTSFFLLVLDG